jgi:phenylpropionate dioxygenase-like ring-hydroxylating dioxygenase large terminal subunit
MKIIYLKFLLLITEISSYIIPNIYNQWFCLDYISNIDKTKPFKSNIGFLPLVSWFHNNTSCSSTINICSHLGSRLDVGKIENGCLKCPYHGLKYNENMTFGKTMIYQDKLWWSYNNNKKPPSIPLYNNKNYKTINLKIDIDANIRDCIINTMDLNHPEFVHNNIFGFGSNKPVSNYKFYKYNKNKIGISFNYNIDNSLLLLKKELKNSNNFHIYEYPFHSWSRVSIKNKEQIFININFLPLEINKTRWFITIRYNYMNNNNLEKLIMELMGKTIVLQDKNQLENQAKHSIIKDKIIRKIKMNNEEHLDEINDMIGGYIYPDEIQLLQLYK